MTRGPHLIWMEDNIENIKRYIKTLIEAFKKPGLEVNIEKTM
jgi:hypothetical protein